MEILYEDSHLIVALKSPDCISEFSPNGDGFADRIQAHCKGYVGVIHRLDRGVGGVMVYAKTPACAAILSDMVRTHAIQKEYLAVVNGRPEYETGKFWDLLLRDKARKMTIVVDQPQKGAQEAILDYERLATAQEMSWVRIDLKTGRTHQIRVQFSSRRMPLVGERKYAILDDECEIALWSHKIGFYHPKTGRWMEFSKEPPAIYPWSIF